MQLTPSPAAAAIDRAIADIAQARTTNRTTTQQAEQASQALDGFKPHIDTIHFDGPGKDVSGEGRALREMAATSNGRATGALTQHAQTVDTTADLAAQIDVALAVLPASASTARYYLEHARQRTEEMNQFEVRDLVLCLRDGCRSLTTRLEPYLVEVEHDDTNRDVGRFAADLSSALANAHQAMAVSALDGEWIDRSLDDVNSYLVSARAALPPR